MKIVPDRPRIRRMSAKAAQGRNNEGKPEDGSRRKYCRNHVRRRTSHTVAPRVDRQHGRNDDRVVRFPALWHSQRRPTKVVTERWVFAKREGIMARTLEPVRRI